MTGEDDFLHMLAGHLGKTVSEIKHTMDSAEFSDWLNYCSRYPFGDAHNDWRFAMVANTVARVAGSETEITDFLPKRTAENADDWRILKAKIMTYSKRGKQDGQ